MKLFLFFVIFFTLSALLGTYISLRLFAKTPLSRIWRIAITLGVVLILFVPVLTIMLRRSGIDNKGIDLLVWSGYSSVGFLSFVFTFLVIRDFFWLSVEFMKNLKRLLSKKTEQKSGPSFLENPSRRGFLIDSMNYGILFAASVSTGYGIAVAKQIPEVKEIKIRIMDLPEDLDGFRIVQITDLHVSPTFRRPYVEKIVEVVNALDADIAALTGDLADGSVSQLSHDVAPLENIKSAKGNFFVTGNHEYYSGVIDWVEEVRRLGFSVLLNEHHIIKCGKGKMLLAGVTDYRGGNFLPNHRSDPLKAMAASPPADVKILLAHQPKSIFEAARAGYNLQISGHTHGGQFFPWNFLVALNQPFVSGLHKCGNTHIYVSRGTGYWGPPLRVCSPSEITLIELTSPLKRSRRMDESTTG